jgi:cytochrome c oxidase subunit 2
VLTACTGFDQQSVLDPSGPQAGSIHTLFITMLVVASLVYVAVVGVFALIVRRRRYADDDPQSPERERYAESRVKLALAVTVPVLFVFLIYDLAVGRGVNVMPPRGEHLLTITVTGHQWWWDVQYEDPIPQNRVHTANEIHIPVGKDVLIKLVSHDVIHSFWVPNLGGKKDLIPGHDNETVLRADKAGVYRSQCAEFCGLEHAKMAMLVVAEPEAQYTAWVRHQRDTAVTPTDSIAQRGQVVFMNGSCVMCHAIAGTRAGGTLGPNLTHVATRMTIAAGTLKTSPGNLAGWIVDPQTIKPGVLMPPNNVAPPDLQALVTYLETLK